MRPLVWTVEAHQGQVNLRVRPARLRLGAAKEGSRPKHAFCDRTLASQLVLKERADLLDLRVGNVVQRFHALAPKHRTDLEVILKIGSDPAQILDDRDLILPKQGGRPDPRELEKLRRLDRPRRHDDLAPGLYERYLSTTKEFDPRGLSTFHEYAKCPTVRQHLQIGAVHDRMEIGACTADP